MRQTSTATFELAVESIASCQEANLKNLADMLLRFDSSVGRGDFVTAIGVGRVIKGWDEGVVTMKLGEKALLDITHDYAYGDR